MAKYIMKCKEVGHNGELTSSLDGDTKTKAELIEFWGLENDDVEWYRLYQVIDGKEVEL
jgi:hypothetical protein